MTIAIVVERPMVEVSLIDDVSVVSELACVFGVEMEGSMDVAIMIEGQDGLNWERWKRHAQLAEDLGFAGLYRSDHFANAEGPDRDALELWTSLTYLAMETKRIEFGPMVSPVSLRNPVVTAWTAGAVDDLSGGRLHLGLGAGWNTREHVEFGFSLLDLDDRFQRFEEGMQVITTLLRSDAPSSFSGSYYSLDNALMLPRPARQTPIVIGGNGPRRTLPLVAKYADEWNAVLTTPLKIRELSARLDALLVAEGRQPGDVRRTLMHRVIIGRTDAELKTKLDGVDTSRLHERGAIVGTPAAVVEQMSAFAEAGIERLMGQWLEQDDVDGLELLATRVLPQLC